MFKNYNSQRVLKLLWFLFIVPQSYTVVVHNERKIRLIISEHV